MELETGNQELTPVDALISEGITRTWLSPHFWANRLQDWRLRGGRFECLAAGEGNEVRTVAILTREIVAGDKSAHLSARTGPLANGGAGFCGFLIGAGGGRLDYRAAALVQRASGQGGGLLCTYESDGQLRFRDHSSEEHPLAFAELQAEPANAPDKKDFLLRLDITPAGNRQFQLALTVSQTADGKFLGRIDRNFGEDEILGEIALVSSGARYWFRDVRSGGGKIAVHPDRTFGPILGTLYSLNERTLKLSVQLAPIGVSEPQTVKLQYRSPGAAAWIDGPAARMAEGFTALLRVDDWDSAREWQYRVVYPSNTPLPVYYQGIIRRDPVGKEPLKIALFSCTLASARSLEGGAGRAELPEAELLGRYTNKNIYFPHSQLVTNSSQHEADLLVFAGDQFYEGNPTRRDNSTTPTLDYLYKWSLWVWSLREMTRQTPTIVLVDDHDVYHGNVWGNGGRAAPDGDQNRGGYRCTAEFINLVQRTQCSHNPDPYDPAPVERGITVYYGAFRYGGVHFAILEDRKFKTAPIQGADLDVHESELLGGRQERFLEAWGRGSGTRGQPRICITQTLFACVQTSSSGRALQDFDSNGYPKLARDRALKLLKKARALVLAGDQHLATVVRHGVDSFEDGPVQFTGPAGGSSWQRWFEPAEASKTGEFVDAFGNKVRVLAVANPKISFARYRQFHKGRGQGLGDRRLKSEGYGIVRVHSKTREFVLECWPWDVDPRSGKQFEGWPLHFKF